MLRNHFKTAFRLFVRNKVYTIINLLGLSLALMICFFAYLYIQDELSYDAFHENSDRIFLINQLNYAKDVTEVEPSIFSFESLEGVNKSPVLNLPFLQQAEANIPEIESLVRIESNYTKLIKDGNDFNEYTQYVDQDFFKVLGFEFLYGDPNQALDDLSSVVVSEDFAMKHFGRRDVIGEEIVMTSPNATYIINGVLSNSQKSVIYTNLFKRIEHSFYFKNNQDNWNYNAVSAFVLLNNVESAAVVNKKLREIELEHRGEQRLDGQRQMLKLSANNPVFEYQLKSIDGIFLDPTIPYGKSSSPVYSLILAGIALVILAIACINYLSISIASAASRRSEIAIRKVIGANVIHLKSQFYAESFILTSIAVFVGFTLTQALMPSFNELAGKEFDGGLFANLQLFGFGLFFGFILGFIAGGYPAQILSRFKVLSGLKGKGSHKIKPKLISTMVIFQFTLCLVFITTSLMMKKQFNYILQKDLGFDKEQVVYVNGVWGKSHLFKEELAKYTSVSNVSGASGIFVGGNSFGSIVLNGVQHQVRSVRMDADLLNTLGLEILDIDGIPKTDINNLTEGKELVNESYYNAIQADTLMSGNMNPRIAGVVKDFHFESLQNEIGFITFYKATTEGLSTLFVKLVPNQIEEGMAAIREAYSLLTEKPLEEISFLDTYLNSRYKDSQKWQRIVNISATAGMLIACIGLFGLTGIGMANQQKELSIRKVLGASYKDITISLNRQSFMLILFSTIVSIPISYYLMESWLSSFAYHVSISADLFAFSFIILTLITILTVTYHSFKVILANPTDILRNE